MKLTAKNARALQLPAGKKDHIVWDDDIPGFGLRLRAGGSRNWVFQYALGEKQRRLSLGAATPESFSSVKDKGGNIKLGIRDQAAQLHAKVKLGQDPASDKTEARKRASDTFDAIAKKYLTAKKLSTRSGTYTETERHILKHARPLNGLQVAKIARRDINTLIAAVKENSGPVAANRVRSTLSDFFGWAMSDDIKGLEANPVIGSHKSKESSRERILEDHELRVIWKCSGDDHYGAIIKLLTLTGQRADEIASLQWSEIGKIDEKARRIAEPVELPKFVVDAIDLPANRTKNKRPHVVPLSDPAVAILTGQHRRVDNDGTLREFVFGIGQRGFSGWSRCKERLDERIAKELGSELPGWTPHDLRRTMSTVMNERLDVLPHVVEAILNHVSSHASGKRGVAGIYNKALYLRDRTEALKLWADHVMTVVGGESNVVSLRA
jgi:integrase